MSEKRRRDTVQVLSPQNQRGASRQCDNYSAINTCCQNKGYMQTDQSEAKREKTSAKQIGTKAEKTNWTCIKEGAN